MIKEKGLPAQAGISTLVGIVIILLVAGVLFGGVFAYQYFAKSPALLEAQSQQIQTQNPQADNMEPVNQTAGWQTYTNTEYGYELQYPNGWFLFHSQWSPGGPIYSAENLNVQGSIIFVEKNLKNGEGISEYDWFSINRESGTVWTDGSLNVDDFWNKLGKTDQNTGEIINKFVEKKTINGTVFLIFDQYDWSVKYQKKIWIPQALFMHNGNFFWIRGGDTMEKSFFEQILSTFKFTN